MSNEEKILDKIKKLLSLATSPNENEAKMALMKAQELMIKHNIENIDPNNVKEYEKAKNVIYKDIIQKGRILWYESSLATVIAKNFKVTSFLAGSGERRRMIFMGLEEDVYIADYVYNYAFNIMKKIAKKNNYTVSIKNTFYNGFINGLADEFKDQIDRNNWGLMIIKDEIVLKEEEKLGLRKLFRSGIKPKYDNNRNIYDKGYKEGRSAANSYNNSKNKLEG